MSVTTSAAPSARPRDSRVIAVVGIAHALSHFSQLLLAPLFPWLKDAFALSYSELGLLMTAFFVVSAIGQSMSGFLVDRVGNVPVLIGSVALIALAAALLASSNSYFVLMTGSVLAGIGNASFHPVDYSVLNARVSSRNIAHAYAAHGVSGNLGWAFAPVFLMTIAQFAGWRAALAGASLLALVVLAIVWRNRDVLRAPAHHEQASAGARAGTFDFLRLPAVWLGFAFFCTFAFALGGVQSFAPEAARQLHAVPLQWAAYCLTAYMLASAGGTIAGGFVARDPDHAERIIGLCFGVAALIALGMAWLPWPGWAVPLLFGAMGFSAGIANPSRDLLIKRATPPGATGRVYGVVYSGLDVGTSVSPLVFGMLMDAGSPHWVWAGIAMAQGALIFSAFRAGRAARVQAPAAGVA